MARRRRFKARRIGRRSFFKRRKGRSSGSMSKGGLMGTIIGGMAYGAGRAWVSDKLTPLTSKLPLGQYADNVGMGILSYFVASGKIPLVNKIPYSREIGRAGLTIEAAFAGQELIGNKLNSGTSSSGTW